MRDKMSFYSDFLTDSKRDTGDWGFNHLGVLHKATCVDIVKNPETDGRWETEEYGLVFRCKDGKVRTAWIMMDAEGNGGGHLDIVGGEK